jgi:iron-sulfur cluster assembly accessory protein
VPILGEFPSLENSIGNDSDLILTPAAHKHLKTKLAQTHAQGLRLSVKKDKKGCAEYSYCLEYVAHSVGNDLSFNFADQVTVFMDSLSYPVLRGVTLDYVRKGVNGQLRLLNPNETASCGCGESFSI